MSRVFTLKEIAIFHEVLGAAIEHGVATEGYSWSTAAINDLGSFADELLETDIDINENNFPDEQKQGRVSLSDETKDAREASAEMTDCSKDCPIPKLNHDCRD